jgi:hypothetical protein
MYLMQPNSRVVNRKFPLAGMGLQPVRLRGLRGMHGVRALAGLGCNCTTRLAALGDDIVPAGTQLSYTATWGHTFTSWNDPNGIQSSIQGVLNAQWGIVVDNQFHTTSDILNPSGQSGFTLLVHTTRDYGAAGDVKSIIDGALYNLGVQGMMSTIAVTKQVAAPTSTVNLAQAQANLAQAQADNDPAAIANWSAVVATLQGSAAHGTFSSWVSSNWPWVAAAGVGLIVVKEVL